MEASAGAELLQCQKKKIGLSIKEKLGGGNDKLSTFRGEIKRAHIITRENVTSISFSFLF